MVAHTFNPSAWEAEAGGFLSSSLPLQSEFQDSQGYTEKPCFDRKKKGRKKERKKRKKKRKKDRKKKRRKNEVSWPLTNIILICFFV